MLARVPNEDYEEYEVGTMDLEKFDEAISEQLANNQYSDVLAELQQYLLDPSRLPPAKYTQYLYLTALIQLHLGATEEGVVTLEKAVTVDPFDGNINHTYGQLLVRNGALHDGIFHLSMAWNSNRANETFRRSLHDALLSSGHSDPQTALDPCDERMYLHPDKEMGIASNAFDPANVNRHKNRYFFAAEIIKGAQYVFDGACGTGYGSEILSEHVTSITAVDLDKTALAYAERHHARSNIRYQQGDLTNLNFGNNLFDAIISLETLEHLNDPRQYLNSLVSLLAETGCFIVSTPITRNGGPSLFNRHHLFEYSLSQLKTLLGHYFSSIQIYVQHLDSHIEKLVETLPDSGFLLAVCRLPRQVTLPLDGDFKRFIYAPSLPKTKSPIHIALIMAKGNDTRDYGIPLGLGYIGAYMEQQAPHFKVTVVMSEEELIAARPDIVGISAVSSTYGFAINMAKQILHVLGPIPVIIGGHHITRLPTSLAVVFTAGVIGEGEQTMLELATALSTGQPLSGLPGLVIHTPAGITLTHERGFLPLDTLPLPWRSPNPLAPNEVTLFTSRGCPYRCVFCSSSGEKFRAFSAEYVVNEIEHILTTSSQVTSLYFLDDLFIADKNRLKNIIELLEKRGLAGRFTARGFIRANLLTPETATLLKRMHFQKVRFGAESGSEKMLSFLKTSSVTVAQNQQCIDTCNAHGLPVSGSFVFGTPGETREDILATFDFIDRNKMKMGVEGFYLLMPLPGTPLWDIAQYEGVVSAEMDWSRLNLDMTNPDFNWESFIYFNKSLTRNEFVALIRTRLGLNATATATPCPTFPGIKLEIGCGESPRPGYTHVDIRKLPWVDIVAPAWNLPLEEGTVVAIYSRHVLEHFERKDGERALKEWLRVLTPGGELHLIVPNMDFHIRQWFEGDREWAMAGFWGWQKHENDVHKWGYIWETLSSTLKTIGYKYVTNLTGLPHSQEKDEKHLELKAYKP